LESNGVVSNKYRRKIAKERKQKSLTKAPERGPDFSTGYPQVFMK
jgi:hypothetical protein